MIEIKQIKATDKLGNIRPLINTALGEIQQDQPMIGHCLNPTVNLYKDGQLAGAITASDMQACWLSALIFPENNGCFVADIIGRCEWLGEGANVITPGIPFNKLVIDIPAIQAPNSNTYTSFLPPSHLHLPHNLSGTTQQFFIGVNGARFDKVGSPFAPFNAAYIETDTNAPNTLNITVTSKTNIAMLADSVLVLNF